MDPATLFASLDAALTLVELTQKTIQDAKKAGLITTAEQDEQLSRVDSIRERTRANLAG